MARRVHEKTADAQFIVASINTHHGPDRMGLWGLDDKTSGVDRQYLSTLVDKIVRKAIKCWPACSIFPATPKYSGNTIRTSAPIIQALCAERSKKPPKRHAFSSPARWAG